MKKIIYNRLLTLVESNIFLRKVFLLCKLYLTKHSRKYFSQFGEDIVLDCFLDLNRKGFYVDVGCFHPIIYNNTYKLYRLGWRGINIDLDSIKIEAFNMVRSEDFNVLAAVSDKEDWVDFYTFGLYRVYSTIEKEAANQVIKEGLENRIKKIRTRTLTSIIDSSPFSGKQIDLLSIDVEGHDFRVLRSLSIEKYKPRLIMIESKKKSLGEVMATDIYELLAHKGYELRNWTGLTLTFAPRNS